jgi:UDP-N-acetylglucosamine 4,6-dehydratase
MEDNGEILSTGPHMRRYFIRVEEAVEIVIHAIENINNTQGAVLTKNMKAAQIADILEVWTSKYGGSWKQIDARPGDAIDEHLIGETELDYTREVIFSNQRYFLTSFNKRLDKGLNEVIYSGNAEKLSNEEN